ncbi:MAG: gliding motility-associated C-terminal domain-containing protein [Bacteroidota bacterium]
MRKKIILFIGCLLATTLTAQIPAPCGPNPAMTSTCVSACVICDIDGFTGRNDLSAQGQTFNGFCTTVFHNMNYIAFVAGSENLSVKVTVTNCNIGWGLEIGFFESPDCETFIPVTECNTNVSENSSFTFTNNTPLTIGQHYYLIMDGSGGDRCDWTFEVVEGTTDLGVLTTSGDISGEMETCANFPTTYTTTGDVGATIFTWTVDGVFQPSFSQTIDLEFPEDGTYELCVTASNVCDSAPPTCTDILVRTPETLNINETICDDENIIVAGDTLNVTGSYEYHITTFNGCDSAIFVELEVLPVATDFVDINLCNGEEFLIGTTPYTQTGIFVDTILTSLGCDSIVNLDLFIIECEIIGSTDFVPPICHGEASGRLIFSVDNGTPPFSYDWSNITDPSIGGTGNTILFQNNEILNVPVGVYEINIMDTFGNDVVVFQEVTGPSPIFINMEAIDLNGFNLSCFGGSDGTATAFPTGGVPPYSYLWENGNTQPTNTNLMAGDYTVSVTDNYGCEQINTINLTEPTVIEPDILFTDPNCDGLETGIISLENISGGTPPYTYALGNNSFSENNTSYENLGPGEYEFNVLDANGCLETISENLNAPDIPTIELGDDLIVQLGCDILIPSVTNNSNIVNITWINTETLDCDNCLRPNAAPLNNTTYQVLVTSIDDCTTTDSITIVVDKIRDVYFPNAFSPNDDGINDIFFIGTGKAVSEIISFQVFSRWGELVYDGKNLPINDPTAGWNGIFNDDKMDAGVFLWTAEIGFIDGVIERYSGDITLIK